MSLLRAGYHASDGLYFRRLRNGGVEIQATGRRLVELTANTWASAVASVSARGETGDTYRAALLFHGMDGDEPDDWPSD